MADHAPAEVELDAQMEGKLKRATLIGQITRADGTVEEIVVLADTVFEEEARDGDA
jgi:hypothetical protein